MDDEERKGWRGRRPDGEVERWRELEGRRRIGGQGGGMALCI